ncbi:MAG TPA: lauroyl acyltransferase [Alphaproteobacteria bacterium]|nr:lauroyl acyltransferase [Alphaproteobacteria bacterium]
MADRSLPRRTGYALQAIALALFLGLCRILPVDWASGLGGWIGRTVGPLLGQNRKAARNLARAFPDNSVETNARILRGMWDNLGRVIAEYPHLPRICAKLEGGRVEVVGIETIRALATDEKPGILFGAHLANWEVQPFIARHTGLELALIYRAPNNEWVDRLLRRLRDAPLLFRKGQEGARALFSLLRGGGHVAMLVDQKMNDGIAVPFFGRDAMTAPAIAQFGLRLGCVIVPVRTERLRGARFRITVYPPLEMPNSGDRTADELAVMTTINGIVEDWVRARPEQWLWLHRRWPD